jgi:hypothetical protein
MTHDDLQVTTRTRSRGASMRHRRERLRSMTKPAGRAAVTHLIVAAQLLVLLALWTGCGVQEQQHPQAAVDTSKDFGSTATAGQRSNPSRTPAAAGAAGMDSVAVGGTSARGAAGATGRAGANSASPAAGSGTVATAGTGDGTGAGAGDAETATTLDIGGTPVAKEDAIAFIHFGHSNMAGRATGPTGSRPYFFTETDPHAWMYHAGQPLQLAKEPYTAGDDLSGTYGGPGTALVKQAAAMAPDKYFVSLGFGKTSAYCSQFLPGSLYYTSLMKAALAIKDRVTFAAIVIMLGITERHGTSADISGYADCINKLVTAIRTDVGVPDLPLLITEYEQATGALAQTSAFAKSIIPQIEKIPSVVSNSALVPTTGIAMQDDHHFNFDGHKVYTQRVLQIMKDKGWFPWAQ